MVVVAVTVGGNCATDVDGDGCILRFGCRSSRKGVIFFRRPRFLVPSGLS